jgi:hypothetical protein
MARAEIDDVWDGPGKAEVLKVPDEVRFSVVVRELDIGVVARRCWQWRGDTGAGWDRGRVVGDTDIRPSSWRIERLLELYLFRSITILLRTTQRNASPIYISTVEDSLTTFLRCRSVNGALPRGGLCMDFDV